MKKCKEAVFVFLCITFALVSCSSGPQAVVGSDKNVTAGDMTISWELAEDHISFTMSAPQGRWMAIGFGPEFFMQGANIIIGRIKNGEAVLVDEYADSPFGHSADTGLGGTNDILSFSSTAGGDRDLIKFSIPYDSGDEFDTVLVPGNTYTLIGAWGSDNDINKKHTDRFSVSITL